MTHPARILILAVFVMGTATVSAYLANSFLMMIEALHSLPRVSLYAPAAGLITNLITPNAVPDPAAQARFAVSREFTLIQSAVFMCLVILSSIFAFIMRNPKSVFSVISCGLFVVVPGTAILKVWTPVYFSYRAPDVHWAFLDFKSAVLQMALSVPFYAVLFFAGASILTGELPRAARAR